MKVRKILRWTGYGVSMVLLSFFLSKAAITAREGDVASIFVLISLTWLSYMSAHKLATGRYVDGKNPESKDEKDEKMTPKDLAEDTGFIAGAAVFVIGMVVGAMGVSSFALWETFSGGLLFSTGYVIAHWSTTGELL